MQLPNKLYSYKESILSKFPDALRELKSHPCSVSELYLKIHPSLSGTSEYLELLNCLYALGKIEYDEKEEVLRYAG